MWSKILWLVKTNWKTTIAGWLTGGIVYVLLNWLGIPIPEEVKLAIGTIIGFIGTFIPDGTQDPLEKLEH